MDSPRDRAAFDWDPLQFITASRVWRFKSSDSLGFGIGTFDWLLLEGRAARGLHVDADKSFPVRDVEIIEQFLLFVRWINGSHVTEQARQFVKRLLFRVEHHMYGPVGLNHLAVRGLGGAKLADLDGAPLLRRELGWMFPDHYGLEAPVQHLDVDTLLKLGDVGESDARQLLFDAPAVDAEIGKACLESRLDEPHEALAHRVRSLLDGGRGIADGLSGLLRVAIDVGVLHKRLLAWRQGGEPRNFGSRNDFVCHRVACKRWSARRRCLRRSRHSAGAENRPGKIIPPSPSNSIGKLCGTSHAGNP